MVKIHERKFVSADPEKCVGCQICEYICSWTKEKGFNPLKSRIRVVRVNQLANMAVTCRRCEDPPCVAACPRDALTQSEETGTIMLDADKCNGCGWCIEACDFGAIVLNRSTKSVVLCDLCQGRSQPKCVELCPKEALKVSTLEIEAQSTREKAAKSLISGDKQT